MTVRSKTLVGPVTIGPGLSVTHGPPAGTTWVIRTLVLVNSGGAAVAHDIGIDGTGVGNRLSTGLTVPANGRRVYEERWYIPNPRTLRITNNSGTTSITYTLFGAELAGIAP